MGVRVAGNRRSNSPLVLCCRVQKPRERHICKRCKMRAGLLKVCSSRPAHTSGKVTRHLIFIVGWKVSLNTSGSPARSATAKLDNCAHCIHNT